MQQAEMTGLDRLIVWDAGDEESLEPFLKHVQLLWDKLLNTLRSTALFRTLFMLC